MPLITAISLILPKNACGPWELKGKSLGKFSQDVFWDGKLVMSEIYFASMQDQIQRQILDTFLVLLKPIAKILLRCGIGFREFSEIAKTAFVDVATAEYGLRGRPTNISRVAVMTGLTRKEVRRLRDKIEKGEQSVVVKTTPLCEVLHRWHSDSEYIDKSGNPAELFFAGDAGSFTSLVKRYGGDIPPGAMRTELLRVGAIEKIGSEKLRVLKRSVSPAEDLERLTVSIIHGAYPLMRAIEHNLNPDRSDDTWPQITAFTQSVRDTDIPRIRRISTKRLSEISESFDDLFMAYETLHDSDEDSEDKNLIAVGFFYFEEKETESKSIW